ncbi:recombinase family protein [Deinococcus sp. HMF7604]|uniref:recombinase family protein n=1 Tax=Deinococcus betulae TaxID=2873312 RepID=UPI001CD01F03|nr:recombinase family protein [Deinococcus betulae]MBZ9753340.1 recombinase family protein [Deinococcus betulae]
MNKGQRVGYIRVSSLDQNTARQLDGIELDRCFEDRASGKNSHRPQLQELLRFVREGDTVMVHSMDRLARNVDDLRQLVLELTGRGVRVEFVREGLVFAGNDAPLSVLILTVLGAVAEFLRQNHLENQREGIAKAKQSGKYKGRKPALSTAQAEQLRRRAQNGEAKAGLARELGISRETLYSYLRSG